MYLGGGVYVVWDFLWYCIVNVVGVLDSEEKMGEFFDIGLFFFKGELDVGRRGWIGVFLWRFIFVGWFVGFWD